MVGSTILHYSILEKLGEGGMGIVYKAHDTKLDRIVALKFLPTYLTSDSNEKERFYHEARAAASLTHQNVAVIYEINEYNESIFLAMEYVEGKTLKKIIERESESLNVKKVLEIAIQICEGLAAAHVKGIVHRDIKSDNIMLTPRGQVKITDFGLAKIKGATRITQMGTTLGTAAYMSPEQAQGVEVDHRSDIFSFGIVLYEMLTTHLPFKGDYQTAILYSLINENPQPIARYNDKVSAEFERIVFKALEKDREERYQHSDEIKADLKKELKNLEYVQQENIVAKTVPEKIITSHTESQKKLSWKIITPATIVVLIALLFILFNPFKSSQLSSVEKPNNSLAVMYFDNITDPTDNDHTGGILTNLLTTSLSQINGLEVISRERLLDIQNDMGHKESKILSPPFAEQVAKRAGVKTMLIGSVLEQKPELSVTASLIDVQTGNIISSLQLRDYKASQIFTLVDSLSNLLLNKLSNSSTLYTEIKSVADVTTKSPEAYRDYVEGRELIYKGYEKEAKVALSHAIELDKNFAMAYYFLGGAQLGLNEVEASEKSLQKAVELSDKTTMHERLLIQATNYFEHNELTKAIPIYEQLMDRYPHDISPYNQLGMVYGDKLFEPEKAIQIFRRGLTFEPNEKSFWINMSSYYMELNRKKEALDACNKYIDLAPAEPIGYDSKGDIYGWFGEYDSSRVYYQKAVQLRADFYSAIKLGFYELLRNQYTEAKKYFEITGFVKPFIEVHKGQLQSAEKILMQIPDSKIPPRDKLRIMINYSYEMNKYNEMLRYANQLTAISKKDPINLIYGRDYLVWALIKNGKSSEAKTILDDLHKDVDDVSTYTHATADYSSALFSFEEGKNQLALEEFNRFIKLLPPSHGPNIFYAIALLKNGQSSKAIEELQRLIYRPTIYNLPYAPGAYFDWPVPTVKAYYWLGVAYQEQGNKAKSIQEYKKFLEIWKDADFNSPEIKDAKIRLAKLK